jgi:cytochrome c oxidase cbb3-type subunit 3
MSEQATTASIDQPAAKEAARRPGPVVLDHSYDGIREYDNPLPGWWRITFYATIVFAIGYWIWFHGGGPGVSEKARYVTARKAYDELRANRRAAEGAIDEATIADRARDPAAVARGAKVFAQFCVACHTDNGRGLVGPNLTDDFQKHGHTRTDLYRTVREGLQGTAMVAWSEMLRADQILDVVSFVATLRHTNVPDGKFPEGERVEPFSP